MVLKNHSKNILNFGGNIMEATKKIRFGTLRKSFGNGNANNITFCVTEECNLRCKYCYMVHKNNFKKMSFETAKKAVDYVLKARDIYSKKSVVWDFIGGEPFLEIDLIDKVSDYIKEQMYLTKHPWFDDYMFSFSKNGLLYGTKKVQDYIKKNKRHISIGISVDGNKIKHDMQRVYPDGRGSYDDVMKNVPLWLSQFPNHGTKATFSHGDLPYLKDSIIHLWNIGIKEVAANVVFEDVWEEKDPEIFEDQLKQLADYVVDNDIFKDPAYTVRLFNPSIGLPLSKNRTKNPFCGAGKMLAINCDGNFFPCIRFLDFSLTKQKGYPTGNVNEGVYKDRLKPFEELSIGAMSDEECKNCEVASGCAMCTGFCYDDGGTIFKRTKYICKMHKANVRAANYFWDKVGKKLKDEENPRKDEIKKHRASFNKYLIIYTDSNASPHCGYFNTSNMNNEKTSDHMSEETIEKALAFADSNMMTPVFVGAVPEKYSNYTKMIDALKATTGNNVIAIFDNHCDSNQKFKICNLLVSSKSLSKMFDMVKKIFENNEPHRVNIILQDIWNIKDSDVQVYKMQLQKISDFILNSDRHIVVNLLNGFNAFNDKPYGCECGTNTFTVAPNGKLYTCPAFYFEDKDYFCVGDLDNGFSFDDAREFKIESSKKCNACKNLSCNRCVYINKKMTNEFRVSPEIQCELSSITQKIADDLKEKLDEKNEALIKEMVNL